MTRQKSRWRSQDGSLILVLGVVATLAILATALVVLVNNAQSNTAKDRERTQAFSLAEGAMDDGMSLLATAWPYSAAPTWNADQFWTRFSTNSSGIVDYASPVGGKAHASVQFYDNADENGDGVVGYGSKGWDAALDATPKPDNLMYIEAQGNVGKKSARVRALVRLDYANLGLLANVAIFTPGGLFVNSATTVAAEVLGPPATSAQAYDYSIDQQGTLSQVTNNTGVQDINKMISPETLALLKTAAKSASPTRYFTSQPTAADFERGGLIYIDAPTQDITWPSNVGFSNTGDGVGVVDASGNVLAPGCLIVNAKSLKWQSNVVYYGLIYCSGPLDVQGTADIHGMMITASSSKDPKAPALSISGNWTLYYNDNVRQNLNKEFPSNVTIERNSWQEINPR